MRFRLFLSPLCALLLGSCAYQGTIVEKDATPLPFEQSYGLEGSYAFLLRDNAGTVRRQIVTAEVYHQYAVGEYFNDLEPRRVHDGKTFDGKTVLTAMMSKVTPRRTANARKAEQKRQVAKAAKASKPRVTLAKKSRPAPVPQATSPTAATVQPRKALPVTPRPLVNPPQTVRPRTMWHTDFAFVSVQRCR